MLTIRIGLFILGLVLAAGIFLFLRAMQYPAKIRKAEELLDNGESSRASELVKLILERKKDYVPARYLRAQILARQKQYLLAISELNSILTLPDYKKHVTELEIFYMLAELYHETQQWQKEVEVYKKILQYNPDDVNANHRVGLVFYRHNDFGEARNHLLKAMNLDPTLTDTLTPLGVSSYHMAEYDDAEQFLLKALEKSPSNHDAHFFLGMIYKMKKDHETAITMFEDAKIDKKYYLKSIHALGQIYFENEMYDKAIEILEQGLPGLSESDEDTLEYRYLLAECYEHQNKIQEAVHHWEKISQINPNYRSTQMKLDDYRAILDNTNLRFLFTSSLTELQPLITEIIAQLNFSIVSKREISSNEYMYKCFSVKRINEPPMLIYFNRTTKEITEGQVAAFHKRITEEKCKSGMYITTSRFSIRAKSAASSRMIELMDARFLQKTIEKIKSKK
jgi:tetratricopeptide (TPR) repeat protein